LQGTEWENDYRVNRNRFDLFHFPKGPHSGDKLPWNANSRT
jgi:hypothetical protein